MTHFDSPVERLQYPRQSADYLRETRKRALELMDRLGRQELGRSLQELGWHFAFDRARRRLGSCHWSTGVRAIKRITVSRHYAAHLGPDFFDDRGVIIIDDVIRHEIAHAVEFETRGRSDHGPAWKRICYRVGADPSRLYESASGSMPHLPGKYLARCPACGAVTTYYRRPSRPRACRMCCENHASGRFDARFALRIVQQY